MKTIIATGLVLFTTLVHANINNDSQQVQLQDTVAALESGPMCLMTDTKPLVYSSKYRAPMCSYDQIQREEEEQQPLILQSPTLNKEKDNE
jgi:hypothetical protein